MIRRIARAICLGGAGLFAGIMIVWILHFLALGDEVPSRSEAWVALLAAIIGTAGGIWAAESWK